MGFQLHSPASVVAVVDSPPTQPVAVHGTPAQLVLFLVFNLWTSLLGLPVLLSVVLLSKRVKRYPTFSSFTIAFIITGLSSSLLAFAGKTLGPQPSALLCLLQASLLYGMPPLTSSAAFALVFQMFVVVRASYWGRDYKESDHTIRRWMLLTFPYIMYLITVVTTSVVGSSDPRRVSRDRRFFYCSVESRALTNTITICAGLILLATLSLIGWTMALIVKYWIASKKDRYHPGWELDLNFPIRIIVFGVYVMMSTSLSFLSISPPSSPVPDLMVASSSTAFVLVFGSQSDIMSVLTFGFVQGQHLVRPKRGSSVNLE